jgi:hypothetical protein
MYCGSAGNHPEGADLGEFVEQCFVHPFNEVLLPGFCRQVLEREHANRIDLWRSWTAEHPVSEAANIEGHQRNHDHGD